MSATAIALPAVSTVAGGAGDAGQGAGTPEGNQQVVGERIRERGTRGKKVDYMAMMLGREAPFKNTPEASMGHKRTEDESSDMCSPSKRSKLDLDKSISPGEGGIKRKGVSDLRVCVEDRSAKVSRSATSAKCKPILQEEVIGAIGKEGSVTEKNILERVGDNRYAREIVRKLLAQGMIVRKGKGGSNDPFLYSLADDTKLDQEGRCIFPADLPDPGLDVRLKRIETKIIALLVDREDHTSEKAIRALVGDNTGTGKALRRLVKNGQVLRTGKGGVGNPYRYKLEQNRPLPVPSEERAECTDEEDLVADLSHDPLYLNSSTSPSLDGQASSPGLMVVGHQISMTNIFSPNWARAQREKGQRARRGKGKGRNHRHHPQQQSAKMGSPRDEENEGRNMAKLAGSPSLYNITYPEQDMAVSPFAVSHGVTPGDYKIISSPASWNGTPKFFGTSTPGAAGGTCHWFGQDDVAKDIANR